MIKLWTMISILGALASFSSISVNPWPILTEEAKDDRIAMYQRAVKVAVEISLNVSAVMSNVIDRIYAESDRVEIKAGQLKAELIQLTHSIITKGNQATQCVNAFNPSTKLSKMFSALTSCTKCLDESAHKCSQLETELTGALNHYRSHVMQGMDALDKCEPSGLTTDETCLRTVNEELEEQTDALYKNLMIVKDKVVIAETNVSSSLLKCCKDLYQSMGKVKTTLNNTEVCKHL